MSVLPEDLYKRRHFGTPESLLLIVVNYVVMGVAIEIFAMCTKVGWGFYIVMVILAFYNLYVIKRNRDEFNKPTTIGYLVSIAGLILMFFLFRMKAEVC